MIRRKRKPRTPKAKAAGKFCIIHADPDQGRKWFDSSDDAQTVATKMLGHSRHTTRLLVVQAVALVEPYRPEPKATITTGAQLALAL